MERRGFIGGTLAALAGVLGKSEGAVGAALVEARPTRMPLLLLWHQGQMARVEDGQSWPAGWEEGWVAVPVNPDGTMPKLGTWDGSYHFCYTLAGRFAGYTFSPELCRNGQELREVGEERALWTLAMLEEFGTVPGGEAREQLRERRRQEMAERRERPVEQESLLEQRARRRRAMGSVPRGIEETAKARRG